MTDLQTLATALFEIEAMIDDDQAGVLDRVWELLQEFPLHKLVTDHAIQGELAK